MIDKVRKVLPARRTGYTQEVRIADHMFFFHTGEYEDGTLGEIFIDAAKEGTFLRSILNATAISVSLGLQHGVPLEKYVEAFRSFQFEPSGIVSGHKEITETTSFLDLLFRDLASHYLGYVPENDATDTLF